MSHDPHAGIVLLSEHDAIETTKELMQDVIASIGIDEVAKKGVHGIMNDIRTAAPSPACQAWFDKHEKVIQQTIAACLGMM